MNQWDVGITLTSGTLLFYSSLVKNIKAGCEEIVMGQQEKPGKTYFLFIFRLLKSLSAIVF